MEAFDVFKEFCGMYSTLPQAADRFAKLLPLGPAAITETLREVYDFKKLETYPPHPLERMTSASQVV